MADLTIVAATVIAGSNAVTARGVAGETITAGIPLYKDSTDSDSLKKADSDALASAACVGIALHGASDGQPLTYQISGNITIGATVTVGETYAVSTNAGLICPETDLTTDDYVTTLGVATTAAVIALQIQCSGVKHP